MDVKTGVNKLTKTRFQAFLINNFIRIERNVANFDRSGICLNDLKSVEKTEIVAAARLARTDKSCAHRAI